MGSRRTRIHGQQEDPHPWAAGGPAMGHGQWAMSRGPVGQGRFSWSGDDCTGDGGGAVLVSGTASMSRFESRATLFCGALAGWWMKRGHAGRAFWGKTGVLAQRVDAEG